MKLTECLSTFTFWSRHARETVASHSLQTSTLVHGRTLVPIANMTEASFELHYDLRKHV